MNYRIGYTPVKRRLIKGESVLNKIKYDKLRVVGAGANGIVLVDGKYAIKVGHVYHDDYSWLECAAKQGYAPPVLFVAHDVAIDQRILDVIRASKVKRNGWEVDMYDYLNGGEYGDIMVSMMGVPFLDNNKAASNEERDTAYEFARKVKDTLNKAGISWSDPHPWNLAWYNSSVVVIDP